MILNIKADLDYQLGGESSVLLQLEVAPLPEQTILSAHVDVQTPDYFGRVSGEDGIGERIWIQANDRLTVTYQASVRINRGRPEIEQLAQVPAHLLPSSAVKFLMASRFCPADEFQSFVQAEFGHLDGGARIAAMRNWIERSFEYVSGVSDAQTTALDTFVQRKGICRDLRM